MSARAETDPSLLVLYIEDNAANARLVEMVLRRRPDVTLISAATGAEGVEVATRRRPDLVLLDLHLPDMHGTEVLRRLPPDLRVVVVSAAAMADDVERARAAGATDYLTKPIDIARLLELVDGAAAGGGRR